MKHPIFSHTYPNGLVLLAEPMNWLQSAAFTFLVPAGCAHDPADRAGLSSFACEMALRARRSARQPPVHPRPGQPGRGAERVGLQRPYELQRRHAGRESAPALAIYADVLRRPHLPEDQLEAGRLAMLQELRAVEDEPAQKVMMELRRQHYPEPWGRSAQGEQKALEATTIDDIRPQIAIALSSQRRDPGRGGPIGLAAAEGPGRRAVGRLAAGPALAIEESPAPGRYQHLVHDSQQTQIGIAYDAVPYRRPRLFPGVRRGGRPRAAA